MANERVQRRIDILLDEADGAFAQRDWETVRQRAQDALALDPQNQDAITFLAAAHKLDDHVGLVTLLAQVEYRYDVGWDPKRPMA